MGQGLVRVRWECARAAGARVRRSGRLGWPAQRHPRGSARPYLWVSWLTPMPQDDTVPAASSSHYVARLYLGPPPLILYHRGIFPHRRHTAVVALSGLRRARPEYHEGGGKWGTGQWGGGGWGTGQWIECAAERGTANNEEDVECASCCFLALRSALCPRSSPRRNISLALCDRLHGAIAAAPRCGRPGPPLCAPAPPTARFQSRTPLVRPPRSGQPCRPTTWWRHPPPPQTPCQSCSSWVRRWRRWVSGYARPLSRAIWISVAKL